MVAFWRPCRANGRYRVAPFSSYPKIALYGRHDHKVELRAHGRGHMDPKESVKAVVAIAARRGHVA